MKRSIALFLLIVLCLCLFASCNKDKKEPTVADVAPKEAEKALSAYKKAVGKDAIADGSYLEVIYKGDKIFYKITDGKIGEANSSFEYEIRDSHTKVSHSDLDTLPETTIFFLETGSKLPEGFAEKEAMEQLTHMVELYHVPIDGVTRVLPDEAIFVIEINGEKYYYMCMDDAIKDQSKDYKKLVESDEYIQDTEDYFSETIHLYFKLGDEYNESQARAKAESVITMFNITVPEGSDITELKTQTIPDGAIIVVKYEGKTYYFMCEDGAVKDQSKDYKDLIKSDDYKQDKDHEFGDGIKLYIKK